MLSKEELETLNCDDWYESIRVIEKYWNTEYGSFHIEVKNGNHILELRTGDFPGNEKFINNVLINTAFWILWWRKSKRGSYHKFVYTEYRKEGELSNGDVF